MKLEELQKFYFTGKSTPSARTQVLVCAAYVSPIPDDALAHRRMEEPAPASSYNAMTLDEVSLATRYRDCDALHRPDIVARDVRRGNRFKETINKYGLDKFISSYGSN